MENESTTIVFSNPLIWGRLGLYLGLGDLKDCRLVCKTFDEKVTQTQWRKWKKRTQIHIKDEMWSSPDFHTFVESGSLIPDSVKITLPCGPEVTEAIKKASKIFQEIKCITIHNEVDELNLDLSKLEKTFSAIFKNCSASLKTLILDCSILATGIDFSTFFTKFPILQSLKKLQITEADDESHYDVYNEENFRNSFLTLAQNLKSLEIFLLPKTEFQHNFALHDLTSFLSVQQANIKKLELGQIDALDTIANLRFPNLTHLSVRVSKEDEIFKFLSIQPCLHSLTLKLRNLLSLKLFNLIKVKSENFVSFGIKSYGIESEFDWSFLNTLTNLREFFFTIPSNNPYHGSVNYLAEGINDFLPERTIKNCYAQEIIRHLPEKMTKICFRSGFQSTLKFGPEIVTKKFKDLEELSLILLDDSDFNVYTLFNSLQEEGEHNTFPFQSLRKFHLACQFADFEEAKLPGKNAFWAGLRDVSIRKMSKSTEPVSEDALIGQLSSTDIRKLTLRNIPITQTGMQNIIESNKALEEFTHTSNYEFNSGSRLKNVIRIGNPEEIECDSDEDQTDESLDNDSDSDVEGGYGRRNCILSQFDEPSDDDQWEGELEHFMEEDEDGRMHYYDIGNQDYCERVYDGCDYDSNGKCARCGEQDPDYRSDSDNEDNVE